MQRHAVENCRYTDINDGRAGTISHPVEIASDVPMIGVALKNAPAHRDAPSSSKIMAVESATTRGREPRKPRFTNS